MKQNIKHDFSIRSTSARRNRSAQTLKRYIFLYIFLTLETGEIGLSGGTRVSVTLEKRIPKKKKNVKSKALSPFLTGNKILLNKDNDHNNETANTSLSEKDDMSHNSPENSTQKRKNGKILMMMTNTRRKLRKFKTVMKVLIILKLQILCVMMLLSRQPRKKKN